MLLLCLHIYICTYTFQPLQLGVGLRGIAISIAEVVGLVIRNTSFPSLKPRSCHYSSDHGWSLLLALRRSHESRTSPQNRFHSHLYPGSSSVGLAVLYDTAEVYSHQTLFLLQKHTKKRQKIIQKCTFLVAWKLTFWRGNMLKIHIKNSVNGMLSTYWNVINIMFCVFVTWYFLRFYLSVFFNELHVDFFLFYFIL